MAKRVILFAPTALSLLAALAAVVLTTRPSAAQRAADDCVTRPGSTAPQGSHWYYRYDRPNARQCWYLGPEGAKVVSSPRRALSSVLRLPAPRPPFLTAGVEAYASAEVFSPAPPPATGGAFADAAASFAQRWPRSVVSPSAVDSERVALGGGPAASQATPIGSGEAPTAAGGEDDLPLVWPILTADQRAGTPTSYGAMTALDRALTIFAAVLALLAMMTRALVKRSDTSLDRARPVTSSSAAVRRARQAGAGEGRQFARGVPLTEARPDSRARRQLSRG